MNFPTRPPRLVNGMKASATIPSAATVALRALTAFTQTDVTRDLGGVDDLAGRIQDRGHGQ
jgi:hypothetical protein